MINDQSVELERKTYDWYYDENIHAARDCWVWMDSNTYKAPPDAVQNQLNRRFLAETSVDMVAELDESEYRRFCEILKTMGAADSDLAATGIPRRYWTTQTDDEEITFDLPMPAATHTPLNSMVVRDWYFSVEKESHSLPSTVGLIGEGPFEQSDLSEFLQNAGIEVQGIDPATEYVLLGRDEWTQEEVDDLIDGRRGRTLRIYSQEMFLTFMACGTDPFYAEPIVLYAFRDGHVGLEFVSEGWSGWVATFVHKDGPRTAIKRFIGGDWPKVGPLHEMGYVVGNNGAPVRQRRRTLRNAFKGEIPIVGPSDYMALWGTPGSAARLRKIADSIASFCRSKKHDPQKFEQAIEDWESDLVWPERRILSRALHVRLAVNLRIDI